MLTLQQGEFLGRQVHCIVTHHTSALPHALLCGNWMHKHTLSRRKHGRGYRGHNACEDLYVGSLPAVMSVVVMQAHAWLTVAGMHAIPSLKDVLKCSSSSCGLAVSDRWCMPW